MRNIFPIVEGFGNGGSDQIDGMGFFGGSDTDNGW